MSDSPRSTDVLLRFLLGRTGVRGVMVSLDEAWQEIRRRESYPDPLAALLGETAAAAALFTGHVKVEGRLSIQLKGGGALRTLFAECTHRGTVRGLALWEGELPSPLDLGHLGEGSLLAITIEKPPLPSGESVRYQGLVALEHDSLSRAFESYFSQSEQLPTRLLLAADGQRARGLMLQVLPGAQEDEDAWPRTQALFETLGAREMLDTAPAELLHRLFHEELPELLSQRELAFGCSCSRERVGGMLLALGHEQAMEAIDPDLGAVGVQCEFCGQRYRFDPVDLEQLFAGGGIDPAAPTSH
ncbi:Hsp33 family molecular chaperone HslO [Pseudomarimonas salicorniae]|uniref:Hsp33 family molecular chaperone HslO n=1 Tax=Pseudomarimonas salicorniae TaxID=2933270 RepID=A0ABT0GCN9_9GAMM|nr:Hsp33 family molecular chaperone HslO [Lysobacter sp. CAU 1642]MCK7592127.1 Hsp33 family molecular chaperone HslO [Lysobacter sp. CAU 1642]